MHGHHQILNAITAAQTLMVLRKSGVKIPNEAIQSGISRAALPARIQVISQKPLVIVDGSHNPDGVKGLADVVEKLENQPKILVMGMLKDKDVETAVSEIAPLCKHFIATEPNNPRKMDSCDLAELAQEYCDTYTAADFADAAKKALSLVGEDGAVIVCGSLYMAGDMKHAFEKELSNV